jgi:hypothetical protein
MDWFLTSVKATQKKNFFSANSVEAIGHSQPKKRKKETQKCTETNSTWTIDLYVQHITKTFRRKWKKLATVVQVGATRHGSGSMSHKSENG